MELVISLVTSSIEAAEKLMNHAYGFYIAFEVLFDKAYQPDPYAGVKYGAYNFPRSIYALLTEFYDKEQKGASEKELQNLRKKYAYSFRCSYIASIDESTLWMAMSDYNTMLPKLIEVFKLYMDLVDMPAPIDSPNDDKTSAPPSPATR